MWQTPGDFKSAKEVFEEFKAMRKAQRKKHNKGQKGK